MRHLVVLAKAPRIGAVKRRLARGIGDIEAWRFYCGTLRETLRATQDVRWRCWLLLDPPGARLRTPHGWTIRPQVRGDLGRRMADAFAALPPGPVVLVGADIPGLDRTTVADAFRALERAPAVFGPAEDGGYWLVGFRRRGLARAAFRDVRWSTVHALADTRGNLPRHVAVALLPPREDVDEKPAWERWRAR